jgi:hypothetical protein
MNNKEKKAAKKPSLRKMWKLKPKHKGKKLKWRNPGMQKRKRGEMILEDYDEARNFYLVRFKETGELRRLGPMLVQLENGDDD